MRFGLLCDDPQVMPIVDALASGAQEHQLTCAVRITPKADALLHGRANVRFVEHWEDLLVAKDVDAVVVGGSDPKILEGAKQIAAAGIPMMFVPQADQGSTFAYELSLIRDDNHVALWPFFWHRYDKAALRMKQAIRDGELGRIPFLQLQRTISQSLPGTPIPQARVDEELLNDIDLPRWLIGDYDQVTCLQTAATEKGVQVQSVVLAGRGLPEANWSISVTQGSEEWKLTVRGESRIAILRRECSSRRWIYESEAERTEGDEQETARVGLAAFATAIAQRDASTQPPSSSKATSNSWGDLVKCFETIDATHRSVRRRRTIELHFEPMSERAIFKTQMTAIGCSLLVGTFFLTLAYLGIASLIPLPSWALIGLRALVFSPLIIFLLAQILLPLTRPTAVERTARP